MNISELTLKRINNRAENKDHIQWALGEIESGAYTDNLYELASFYLSNYNDPERVERTFQSCLKDLGIKLECDWYAALKKYSIYLCESIISNKNNTDKVILIFCDIYEDEEVFLFGIWEDLASDIYKIENNASEKHIINKELLETDSDKIVRDIATQFIKLCKIELPDRLPFTGYCINCGYVDVSCHDELCDAPFSHCSKCNNKISNMRLYENREKLIEYIAKNQITAR